MFHKDILVSDRQCTELKNSYLLEKNCASQSPSQPSTHDFGEMVMVVYKNTGMAVIAALERLLEDD